MRVLMLIGALAALGLVASIPGTQMVAGLKTNTTPDVTVPSIDTAGTGGTVSSGTSSNNVMITVTQEQSTSTDTAGAGAPSVNVGPNSVSVKSEDGKTSVDISGSTVKVTAPDVTATVGPDGVEVTAQGHTIKVPGAGVQMGQFNVSQSNQFVHVTTMP